MVVLKRIAERAYLKCGEFGACSLKKVIALVPADVKNESRLLQKRTNTIGRHGKICPNLPQGGWLNSIADSSACNFAKPGVTIVLDPRQQRPKETLANRSHLR